MWSAPASNFERNGELVPDVSAGQGPPLVLRVSPDDAPEWIGTFRAGALGGTDGVFPTPDRNQLCVLVNGHAYLVRVDLPAKGALTPGDDVQHVTAALDPPLLLLVSFTNIVAVGPGGIAWRSPRLVLDDLRVQEVTADGIHCTGYDLRDSAEEILVDPTDGRVLNGPRLEGLA